MIIVTGGAGFIGSVLVGKLNKLGFKDILIVDSLRNGEKWKNLVGKKYTHFINKNDFLDALEKNQYRNVETIFHMGACSSTTEKNADYLMENNTNYSKKILNWALKNDSRFIYASSAATYGNGSKGYSDSSIEFLQPLNMYGYSKHLFDEYVVAQDFVNKVVGLKFFNVFGPNEYHKGGMKSVVEKAFYQVKETGKIKLFKSYKSKYKDGEQKRDFIYVKDVCDIMIWFMNNKSKNGIFNIGTGQARSWNDLAKSVFMALNYSEKDFKIEYIEMPERLKGKYQYFTKADMNKLRSIGYDKKITSLKEATDDYINNYLKKENKYY